MSFRLGQVRSGSASPSCRQGGTYLQALQHAFYGWSATALTVHPNSPGWSDRSVPDEHLKLSHHGDPASNKARRTGNISAATRPHRHRLEAARHASDYPGLHCCFFSSCGVRGSKSEHPVTQANPFRKVGHGRFLRTFVVGLAFADPTTRLTGPASSHRHPLLDQILGHLHQVEVSSWGLDAFPGQVHGIVDEEQAHLFAIFQQLAGQSQRVPSHVATVIRVVVQNKQNTHSNISLSLSARRKLSDARW